MKRVASVCHLPDLKNDNPPKNPALSCAKPACHAPCCRHAPQSSEKVRSTSTASPATQPMHIPHRAPHAKPKSERHLSLLQASKSQTQPGWAPLRYESDS